MALTNHRLRRPLLAVATISTACFGLAACGGSDSPSVAVPTGPSTSASGTPSSGASSASQAPTTSSSATSSAAETGDTVTSDFEAGQCFDDTINWNLTPCGRPHKLEITAVVKTRKYADNLVKRGVLRTWTCNNVVASYVGSPSAGFSRILGQPVPTAIDPNSGKEIVCAAAVDRPDDKGYEQITYPLKNRIKDKGYVDYRICTSDRPSQSDAPKIVPCTKPHMAETTGGYVIGKPDGKYPGGRAVDRVALKRCVPLAKRYLGTTRSDVIAAANSSGKTSWGQGMTMTACFVETTKGTFLKPLKGMQDKPLSKFQ